MNVAEPPRGGQRGETPQSEAPLVEVAPPAVGWASIQEAEDDAEEADFPRPVQETPVGTVETQAEDPVTVTETHRFITDRDEPRFVSVVSTNSSQLRRLESWMRTSGYPVISTGVLKSASRLSSSDEYVRTLAIKGGIVPNFVAWTNSLKYFLPKKVIHMNAHVLGVYTRGTRFPVTEGYNAFFTMDRKVVLARTNSRSTMYVAPGDCPMLPEGAVLSPCDLSLTELENDKFFQPLLNPLTEEQMYNNLFVQFKDVPAFLDINYLDVMPRGWRLSKDAEEKVAEFYDSSLPTELFPERDVSDIMLDTLKVLAESGLIDPGEFSSLTVDELAELYKSLAANHPDLMSNSAADLGSGFNVLEPRDMGDDDDSRAVLLDTAESVAAEPVPGTPGVIRVERSEENFHYNARFEIREVLGSARGSPIPVEWPVCTYERAPCELNRIMSIITTATKLRQGVVFVRGEATGTVGVRLNSAQPYLKSQNTTVKGGRNQSHAIWMENRECFIEGEMWLPVIQCRNIDKDDNFTSASPALHALVRDAQALIMTSIVMYQLDPSNFGPVSSPFLSVLPYGHSVQSCIGEDFDRASFIAPFWGGYHNALATLDHDGRYMDNPINPLYGLPRFVSQFALSFSGRSDPEAVGGEFKGLPVIVQRDPNSSWDYPALPRLLIYDKTSESFKAFPLPFQINDTESEGRTAVELYELLTATGSASSEVREFLYPDAPAVSDNADGPKATNQSRNSSSGDNLGIEAPSISDKAAAKASPKVLRAPKVRQKRGGVTIMKDSNTQVATRRTKTGEIEIARSHGLVWAGPFADCPPKLRNKWSNDLRVLTWLSGERNPTVTAKMSIRKEWFRPLKQYQKELDIPEPDELLLRGEYVLDSYDKTKFDWTLGESV